MEIYELVHVFFRNEDELIHSPKSLGFFYSYDGVEQAIEYYSTQPGFCDNMDAFSARERTLLGDIVNDTVFETIIYLHSEDYEFEAEIELGLYGDEAVAQGKLAKYSTENIPLMNNQDFIVEKIVNKCIIGRREWLEGFSVTK